MAGLRGGDYEAMLDLVVTALGEIDTTGHGWEHVLVDVTRTMEANLVAVFDVAWPDGTVTVDYCWPAWADSLRAGTQENRAYPLIRYFAQRRGRLPRTLDDVTDECRWLTSRRYAAMRAQFAAAPKHLALPLRMSANQVRLVGFGRPATNFTPQEQAFARRLQPILIALDRHATVMSTWRAAASAMSDAPDRRATEAGISPRELAVLVLLADGLPTTMIGRRLGISPRTVTKHQENLQRKLRTGDRLNTVLRAQQLGLVRSGPQRS